MFPHLTPPHKETLYRKIITFRTICSEILDIYGEVIEREDKLIDTVTWVDDSIKTTYSLARYNPASLVEDFNSTAIDFVMKEEYPDGQNSIIAYITRSPEHHVAPFVKSYLKLTEEQEQALNKDITGALMNQQGLKVVLEEENSALGAEYEIELLIDTVADSLFKLGLIDE